MKKLSLSDSGEYTSDARSCYFLVRKKKRLRVRNLCTFFIQFVKRNNVRQSLSFLYFSGVQPVCCLKKHINDDAV